MMPLMFPSSGSRTKMAFLAEEEAANVLLGEAIRKRGWSPAGGPAAP